MWVEKKIKPKRMRCLMLIEKSTPLAGSRLNLKDRTHIISPAGYRSRVLEHRRFSSGRSGGILWVCKSEIQIRQSSFSEGRDIHDCPSVPRIYIKYAVEVSNSDFYIGGRTAVGLNLFGMVCRGDRPVPLTLRNACVSRETTRYTGCHDVSSLVILRWVP
jgi:hypothetical protein